MSQTIELSLDTFGSVAEGARRKAVARARRRR